MERLVGAQLLRSGNPRLGDARHAAGQKRLTAPLQLFGDLRLARLPFGGENQPVSSFSQDTGRLPVLVAVNDAAVGIGRARRDAGQREGMRVRHADVMAHADEQHRVIR